MGQNSFQTITVNAGGTQNKLGQTAALQLKASRGDLRRVVVAVAGSAGALTINDSSTLAGAAAGNQVISYTNTQLNAIVTANNGGPVVIDLPCVTGIAISAVPTGSTINYFFD